MKRGKKVTFVVAVLAMSVVLIGCFPTEGQKSIYNDDEKIAESGNSYTYGLRIENSDDENHINIKYTAFTGDESVWKIEANDGAEITLDFDSKVENGDFKAVLVTPKKEVKVLFEGEKKDKETLSLEKGDYAIKLVGLQGKGKIKITISGNENIKISKRN